MSDSSMYHEGMRKLQGMRETRPLVDRLEQVTVHHTFTDEERAFIERCPMFFIATAEQIFPNCPCYIHKMQLVAHSVYAPRAEHTPPVPAWKEFDVFRDALPARDRPLC
jgi:hypothetical protein